ncbi:MAG: hypothetical protein ACRDBG_09835 [Waterburya sp.]
MPHIVCQQNGSIITRDKPDALFTTQMGTKYDPPKRWAYLSKKTSYSGTAGTYSLLVFASPITLGTRAVSEGWIKDSDWSFEA